MKLLFIRHGEPDYERDCLTENGLAQAQLLAKRLERDEDISAVYISPMGRAQETAAAYLKGKNLPTCTCDWLHEFDAAVSDPEYDKPVPVWDIYPKNWTEINNCFDRNAFADVPFIKNSEVPSRFEAVKAGLDKVLAEHGLVRQNDVYVKTDSCDKTLAFFCHFGASCVMIAYLLGISPIITLQGLSAEPTAIATLCTDDRFGDKVNFRLHGFGDIHHLGSAPNGGINYK